VIVFPNCKINLGLNIVNKRHDGFHDIETIFYPLTWQDALEILKTNEPGYNIQFSTSGSILPGTTEMNLCVQAYHLLKKDFSLPSSIQMHLHKTIPIGAGLGGGSADGAFTLQLLNRLFNIGLSKEKLMKYSLELGSDCPFFVVNKTSFATGRGEVLEEIKLDLSSYRVVIVNPGIHITTSEAFSMVNPASPSKSIKQIIQQPIETWKNELKNDFEDSLFKKHPEIENIKDKLYNAGAVYASMSGSGSTVYGILRKDKDMSLSFPSTYLVKTMFCQT
jgi:4-diphosphocytidyl-2-C-methyl-D-erythritol kinase